MAHVWKRSRAEERINSLIGDVEDVTIVDYTRKMSLENIPKNKAYRTNSVHLYIDILNMAEMLNLTDDEGVRCHQKTLRFLNLHYRAVHRILNECDVLRVDFHNQRLHAVVFSPYDSEDNAEKTRIQRAVAISQLIVDVLKETGDQSEDIPTASVRIGIDSGETLIVNNGRNGGREPLFLGNPANQAAKLSSAGSSEGIYLTNNARLQIGLEEVESPKNNRLSKSEIDECKNSINLGISADKIVNAWKEDLEKNPIGNFQFSSHTPPLKDLKINELTPSNSRRQELISIYADIDGFTKFVSENIDDDEGAKDVIRTLHVVRSELDKVLSQDFEGRKIRFIGDCLHGIFCVGTAQNTDAESSVSEAVLCCGALRSSFELSLEKLKGHDVEVGNLGLAIGFEYGVTSTTRLGMQGDSRVRVSISRSVLESEIQQGRCDGLQTAIGKEAYDIATNAVKNLFGNTRRESNLDYNEVVESLAENDDTVAKSAKLEAYANSSPAIIESINAPVRPHSN